MKKNRIFKVASILILVLLFLTSNANAYINQSNFGDPNAFTKLVTYIESFRNVDTNTVFTIDRDMIKYHKTFFDPEKDYAGISEADKKKANGALAEFLKKAGPQGLQIKYEHTPSVYRNPVPQSSLHQQWYDATISFDTTQNKFSIASDYLFTHPGDDKRGDWKIYLKTKDATGKPLFDKEGIGVASFRVHKPPTPRFSFTETATRATLTDAGSFDIDGSYKNSEGNYSVDKGIKKYEWAAKIGDNWVNLTTSNATITNGGKTVSFNKNGKTVSDYRLTVTDYDGATSSISKNSLIYEPPVVDFDYIVGGNATSYAYSGNAGRETVTVRTALTPNDEAYSSSYYPTSGNWFLRWTGFGTSTLKDEVNTSRGNNGALNTTTGRYNVKIRDNWTQLLKGNPPILDTELYFSNAFDLTSEKRKSLRVYSVSGEDRSVPTVFHSPNNGCGFLAGKDALLKMRVFLPNGGNVEDLEVRLTLNALGINNLVIPMTNASTREFGKEINIPTSGLSDSSYFFSIHSKRTGQQLAVTPTSTLKVHVPLGVERDRNNALIPGRSNATINDSKVVGEIRTDETFITKISTYETASKTSVIFEYDVKDVLTNTMFPAGTEVPLRRVVSTSTRRDWEGAFAIPTESLVGSSESVVNTSVQFKAEAANGRDIERDTLSFNLLSFKLDNFRVVKVRDFQLESFYKDTGTGQYREIEMDVNKMGIDALSFAPYAIDSLAKGYKFEFKIDSLNFNDAVDAIHITPSFYAINGNARDATAKLGYWIDDNKNVRFLGEGAHSAYKKIVLTNSNKTITGPMAATWKGEYFLPGTTFLTNQGTTTVNAKANALTSDIIVHFDIVGYKNGVPRFNYNTQQWGKERTTIKTPYLIGDVIRYGQKSNLDDLEVVRPR